MSHVSSHDAPLTLTSVCVGQHLASAELRLMTAHFFLAFPDARMSSLEGMSDHDMDYEIYFVMSPRGKRCLMEAASVSAKTTA